MPPPPSATRPDPPHDPRPNGRQTVLVLVDEVRAGGLPDATRRLLEALDRVCDPVLVAQSYLAATHRALRWRRPKAVYGFDADGYNANVRRFAQKLVADHAPSWVLAYGWENSQLIVECDRLGVPVVLFVDYPNPAAEGQLTRSILFADAILFSSDAIPAALTTGLWGLQARAYDILGTPTLPMPASTRPWGRLFARDAPVDRQETAARLAEVGTRVAARRRTSDAQAASDAATIRATGLFDTQLFLPRGAPDDGDAADAVTRYLRESRHAVPRDRVFAGRMLRRPAQGFHPLVYATDNPSFDEAAGEDPFAHYLRSGRPAGRWAHPVIRPVEAAEAPALQPDRPLRVALHAHMHYPDLLPELLTRLRGNAVRPDLILTTTSEDRRAEIATRLADAGATAARLVTYPHNRGRDIWPFLDLLGTGAFAAYDLVGHVHGKRSPHYELGDLWRDFLWRHLVGGPERMVDAVAAQMGRDPGLGLVMPEDPHLEGWEEDLPMGTDLAARMGVALPLPLHFEYPMGTMFWARPAALRPLLDLGLSLDDMPPEPLADDGTILHALERLIPFAVAKAGYAMAATYVPGSVR